MEWCPLPSLARFTGTFGSDVPLGPSSLTAAASVKEPESQRRLATVVVGGVGATGVEIAGELAAVMPKVASRVGLPTDLPAVVIVEAGLTILAGSSPQLIDKATRILAELGVQVRTMAAIAAATEEGFRLQDGQLVEGGVFVWAGGLRAPELVASSGLPTGYNGPSRSTSTSACWTVPTCSVAATSLR